MAVKMAILDYLAAVGVLAWRQQAGAVAFGSGNDRRFIRFGQKGLPDVGGMLPDGRCLQIETKRIGKDPKSHQAEFMAKLAQNHAVVIVAHSLDEFRALFDLILEEARGRGRAEGERTP